MKVLHTADWHLGKKLGRFERYEEMGRFADWLVERCEEESVDLVLISGDLFDTPSPPNRAVSLATEALQQTRRNLQGDILVRRDILRLPDFPG